MDKFIGTMPVAERLRFDTAALAAWMTAHVEGYSGTLTAEQYKGGQSNPTFLLTASNGQRWVMRSKPAPKAKLLPSAHAIEREFRVQKALAGTGFPVSRMRVLCEDEGVIGRAFYIMDHIAGRVLWDPALPELSAHERVGICDAMNAAMAELHSLDYKALGLETFGKPGNYFARQIDRWSKQYRLAETHKIPAMERLIEWLPANVPADDTTVLVHGDFRLDNMIFDPASPRILSVLDWELSTLGHPLADFSYHCLPWHVPAELMRGMAGKPLNAGVPTEEAYKAAYCRRTGRAGIDHWPFYIAYNLFRLASIIQGIAKRAVDGTAANQHAADEARRVAPLAELGWGVAETMIKGA